MPERGHQGLRLGAAIAVLAAAILIAAPVAAPATGQAGPVSAGADAAGGKGRAGGKGQTGAQRKREKLRKLRRANRLQKRPNVVVIETDDQDNSIVGMNNVISQIGARGTTFANNYAEYPLCCPSRATFLTGQYAHNHGVRTSDSPEAYNSLNPTSTLPVWLRTAGYKTAMVGKYLNGYGINDGIAEPLSDLKEIPPGWTEWYGLTGGSEQRRYQYKLNENGDVRYYGLGPKNYVTDVLAGKAVDFIKRRAPHPKPFFLWFTPTAPHGENGLPFGATRDPTPAPRHLGRYEGATAPRSPNFDEEDVSDKPDFVKDRPRLTQEDFDEVDRRYRGRMESLLSVDDAVKRIIGKVRKSGDMRKTYIFFTSDNGLQMGSHRLLNKAFLYEESLRVPLIIRGPGFPAGATRQQLTSNVDLAPTIVQLAKAKAGRTMDGRSLVKFAADAGFMADREALFESYQTNAFGIRQGNWVYIQHPTDERELYNLGIDPYELQSLAEDDPERAFTMALRLADLRDCVGSECP